MSSQFLAAQLEEVELLGQITPPSSEPQLPEAVSNSTKEEVEPSSKLDSPSPTNSNLFKTIAINAFVVLFYLCCTISIVLSIRLTSTYFHLRFPLLFLFFQVGFSFFLTLCFLLCASLVDPNRKYAMNRRKQLF